MIDGGVIDYTKKIMTNGLVRMDYCKWQKYHDFVGQWVTAFTYFQHDIYEDSSSDDREGWYADRRFIDFWYLGLNDLG